MPRLECEFCHIVARRKQAAVVFENDRVIVFRDIRPQAKIHLLVCPKAHYATFMEAPPDEVGYLFTVCRALAERLKIENGFRMVINNGPQSGQIIYHLHVHLLSWLKNLEDETIILALD